MRSMRCALPLAVAGVAALAFGLGGIVRADETAREKVEALVPSLMSEDDEVRADAERRLFALGEPARAEIERMSRDNDLRRAVTALRLLQSPEWERARPAAGAAGESAAEREGSVSRGEWERSFDDLRADMERRLEELQRRFEGMRERLWAEIPEMPEIEWAPDVSGAKVSSSGTVVENDREMRWTIEPGGRVRVTMREGKDAKEETYEAKSLEELRREHPDVAERLDRMLPRSGGKGFTFRWGWPRGRGEDRPGPGGRGEKFQAVPERPVLGVEWSLPAEALREQLDLGSGGMVVEHIVPGTLAEKLGLKRHDVLIEVAGKAVAGAEDVRSALRDVAEGQAIKAVVVRKGRRETLEATK